MIVNSNDNNNNNNTWLLIATIITRARDSQKEYKEKRRSFSRKSDLSHMLDPQNSLGDEPTYFRTLTFDTVSCASKVSDVSRRSVSVNEGLMKQEGVSDGLSPTSSLPPSSLINFRGDDDDDGMFSSIIKFAAKRYAMIFIIITIIIISKNCLYGMDNLMNA